MKKPVFLILAGAIVLGTLVIVFFLPKVLMRAATEKPKDVGTFVTAPVNQPDLKERMQQAIQPKTFSSSNSVQEAKPLAVKEHSSTRHVPVNRASRPPQNVKPSLESRVHNRVEETPVVQPPHPDPPAQTNVPADPQTSKTHENAFRFQISEGEIAGMVYNEMHRNIAPEYKQALQGLSVRLREGRAKVTVKLLPKHLPEQYLKGLPGVDRNSPPLYLGGEVALEFTRSEVKPKIYNISLGNLRMPIPVIQSVIKTQVQGYIRQVSQLESGQQAVLDSITIKGGQLSIQGHVQ